MIGVLPRRTSIRIIGLAFAFAPAITGQTGYTNSEVCARCHQAIADTYQRTGMARSFYRPGAGNTRSEPFYHATSDTYFAMSERNGETYQRRWQRGPYGVEINLQELRVDYVIGSGNHARTFLHQSARGTLIQLPLGWYAEGGGSWAMNPGYDSIHPPAQRAIPYECMFCHNAYPRSPPADPDPASEPVFAKGLPEGIDCQRCHGPGARHAQLATRDSIVNPARLGPERQMEVCLQCHLETTSTRLPGMIRKFDRAPFSYIPGQPLGGFIQTFDHAPGSGREDKFEIAGAAYRLRQSPCFLKSNGALTCTSCHNPHDVPRGAAAAAYYSGKCGQCHAAQKLSAASGHHPGADCAACHMPKRRTEDAVHVAMTDHLIQRRKPARDLMASLPESHPPPRDEYHGEVVPYYPAPPADPLYTALAQILQGSNVAAGIDRLSDELARRPSSSAAVYIALGDARRRAGQMAQALQAYEHAVRLKPDSASALRFLGIAARESGQTARAAGLLQRASQVAPKDPQLWFELALLASDAGRANEAVANVRRSIALDPTLPDAHNTLAVNLAATGDLRGAEAAFREALRLDPYYATAHGNLARLLSGKSDPEQSLYFFEKAVRLQPGYAPNFYEYALTLVRMNRFDESEQQARAALSADPNLAEAHSLLGGLLARKQDLDTALAEFEAAVRLKPAFSRAQLDLGATLAARGETDRARKHLQAAANGSDPQVAQQAAQLLTRIEGRK